MSASDILARPYRADAAAGRFPAVCEPLEEVVGAEPADAGAALAFAVARLTAEAGPGADAAGRPLVLVTTAAWTRERGRAFAGGLCAWGAGFARLVWVRAQKEGEALWALEEALKSGAVAGGLVTVAAPAFVATRRLDFAARAGNARAVLLRAVACDDLSAARRRWRISSRASGPTAWDASAPGQARLQAALVRRRDGPPAAWDLELDDETGGFRVAAGLAGGGVAAPDAPTAPNLRRSRAAA
jgi:protein ImuA